MAAVKQQVLNWLYSVLTSEYKDVNRTYNDVAQTLSHYSSLSPRTDVYTYEHGANALLLHLSGTLPVNFRGTTYRFPIALWVPHGYPREAPLAYVTPTEGMMVRPGQHVDPQGKIYHPYLVNWGEYWDKSNILDFLAILRDIFAKEPPVIARQQSSSQAPAVQSPPPIPPLPPGVGRPTSVISTSPRPIAHSQPPPPPPKLSHTPQVHASAAGPSRYENGPPLPPLPPQNLNDGSRYSVPPPLPQNSQAHAPQRSSSLRYETAPPLPPQPHRQESRRESLYAPASPMAHSQDLLHRPTYDQQYQPASQYPHGVQQNRLSLPPSYNHQQPPPPQTSQSLQWQHHQTQQHQTPQSHQQPPKPPPQPPVDLLSTSLTLPIPSASSTNLPPPPIPPNPEKDLLLHNLSHALLSQRTHTKSQTQTSLPGLQAQNKAMLTTLSNMKAELQALESTSSLLKANTSILHASLRDADAVISNSQHRQAPSVDELLIAPNVVGNQLYEVVCEERALGDALFVLGRAVERGRVSPAVFAKMTRGLAREWFLKKALVKKIGKGMGLAA